MNEALGEIGQSRWTAPLLNLLLDRDGARFAEMLVQLGISRDSLVRTLARLIEHGWVMRNPGYGHPLRPEYLLTAQGRDTALLCRGITEACARLDLAAHSLPRWSLPILTTLEGGWTRFSVLKKELAPVTPRALSLNLKFMMEERLVARREEDLPAPAVCYGLALRGRRFTSYLHPR
jgi:DNA-binding HxlR family transcriptional regulator